jgi:hypothetical protein
MQGDSRPHTVDQLEVGVYCSRGDDKCDDQTAAVTEYLTGLFGEAISVYHEADNKAQRMRQAADAVASGIREAAKARITNLQSKAEKQASWTKAQTYAPIRKTLTAKAIQSALDVETEV